MKTAIIVFGLAFALPVAVTAEEAKVEAKAADVEVVVEGNDQMKFSKTEFTVKEGQTVSVTLKNVGKLPKMAMGHNLVIIQPGTDALLFANDCAPNMATTGLPNQEKFKSAIVAGTKMLGPGEEDTITFTAPEPGKYDFLCTFPGHCAAQMRGVMTVEAK
ncbi:MAG: plastocyanin/azurin family copper-binding protein [Verrucomicrobiota bacterium]